MAEPKNEMPATGGSYTRDPKTGKLTRREEPTVQEPGAQTSAPNPTDAAAPTSELASKAAEPSAKAEEN